jgi:glycosyltransferase involved in cell wall biosynthesis
MSICFVAPQAWPVLSRDTRIQLVGGAEVQQSILARLFAANGYRVSMICLDFGQPDRAVVDGVTVHKAFAPQAGLPVLRFLHPRLTAMWRALKQANADIYYYRSAAMWVGVVAAFCRLHGKRCIYAGASDKDFVPGEGGQIRYARDRWLYRRGLASVDRIVAQNEMQRTSCKATFGREATLIPSCYELPRDSQRADPDLVLWVGTVHEQKRPLLLLELARRLPHRRFVMIGGARAGEEDHFELAKREAAALPNVQFVGFLPLAEVEPWFDRARVLVNTSYYEGMPNTFLQAWARGVPTVATVDVGAPVHRVSPTLDALAAGVEEAFENLEPGERCREYFERNYSTTEALRRYHQLFEEVAA